MRADAIRLFLHQVVAQQGLPFDVKAPNAATIAAMREARPELPGSRAHRRLDFRECHIGGDFLLIYPARPPRRYRAGLAPAAPRPGWRSL